MEPIPYYYDSINRNAIIVKPKQPLLDWINSIYPESPIETLNVGTVYLVNSGDNVEQVERWLQKNFDNIFQNELNGWNTDEENWPEKRTFKLFKEWFNYEIHDMILDMEEDEIIKI
ncbi:MAG: hypothetical protein ACTHK8_14240 [Ginsengibacter sp.]